MRKFFIGFEFTHDKQRPNAVIGEQATRVGPIKRWVDASAPHMVEGKLRERVGLVLPSGFRFRKDEIKNYLRKHNSWTDAKFSVAMNHALGKYLPYATKTGTPDGLQKQVAGDVTLARDESATGDAVPKTANEPKVVQGVAPIG
jgi:hypothetical protein